MSRLYSKIVIHGSKVNLLSPFPLDRLTLVYEWLHAYRAVSEHDDSPATQELFEFALGIQWLTCTTFALLRPGDDSEPIGVLYFEPAGHRDGFLHMAMAREAWGKGIADEAAALCIQHMFETKPSLTRISASMMERNRPAAALARRMGFTLEGTLRDLVLQDGVPKNVIHYGLTRREWEQTRRTKTKLED